MDLNRFLRTEMADSLHTFLDSVPEEKRAHFEALLRRNLQIIFSEERNLAVVATITGDMRALKEIPTANGPIPHPLAEAEFLKTAAPAHYREIEENTRYRELNAATHIAMKHAGRHDSEGDEMVNSLLTRKTIISQLAESYRPLMLGKSPEEIAATAAAVYQYMENAYKERRDLPMEQVESILSMQTERARQTGK